MFETELKHIRAVAQEHGQFSWTSAEYQADVLGFIIENRNKGGGLVEVGCYKGGLSSQLAFLCKEFGWPFYTMDVEPSFLELTRSLLGGSACREHCITAPSAALRKR